MSRVINRAKKQEGSQPDLFGEAPVLCGLGPSTQRPLQAYNGRRRAGGKKTRGGGKGSVHGRTEGWRCLRQRWEWCGWFFPLFSRESHGGVWGFFGFFRGWCGSVAFEDLLLTQPICFHPESGNHPHSTSLSSMAIRAVADETGIGAVEQRSRPSHARRAEQCWVVPVHFFDDPKLVKKKTKKRFARPSVFV